MVEKSERRLRWEARQRAKRRRRLLRRLAPILAGLVAVTLLGVVVYALENRGPNSSAQPSSASDRGADVAQCFQPKRIVLLGDSTRDPDGPGKLYVDALKGALPDTKVLALGSNGASLAAYRKMPATKQAVKYKPDAVEVSIGINDLRTDQRPSRVAQFKADLAAFVAGIHNSLPRAQIVLTIPAALSTLDINQLGLIQDASVGVTNPSGAADSITKSLRSTYRDLAKSVTYIDLVDSQIGITGTSADASNPPRFLGDQVHPNAETSGRIADLVAAEVAAC